ncbi:hypothetical protein [Mangrovimonas sp. YM274]|uniref:hypothetical protein n=1 Tax=Mangrovimonas sp. YM274 TaxID=3070660 RepID=UPI0027DC4067|nr:hypothetical protein [Mangrovimonas sp. YM274]WMI70038.1 hypothetical protein RBH95_06735 [Mangrovimonas sp. YM274]
MEKLNAIEFVDKLKELFGSFNISDEQEYLNEILIPESKNKGLNLTGDFLNDLHTNYDLSGRTIGFDFLEKLNENSDFVFFGLSDPFYMGLDKKSGEIIMYDMEYDKVHLRLAENIDQFVQAILLIFEYGLPGWINEKQYSQDDRLLLLSKIKKVVNQNYLTYYEQSYGN